MTDPTITACIMRFIHLNEYEYMNMYNIGPTAV